MTITTENVLNFNEPDIEIDLECAVDTDNINEVIRIMDSGEDINIYGALSLSSRDGHAECLKILLHRAKPRRLSADLIVEACVRGHADCVELLIPLSATNDYAAMAIRTAARYGRAECIRLLIPISDPKANGGEAMINAMISGSIECVELLLPLFSEEYLMDVLQGCPESIIDGEGFAFVRQYLSMLTERRELGELVSASAGTIKKSTRL